MWDTYTNAHLPPCGVATTHIVLQHFQQSFHLLGGRGGEWVLHYVNLQVSCTFYRLHFLLKHGRNSDEQSRIVLQGDRSKVVEEPRDPVPFSTQKYIVTSRASSSLLKRRISLFEYWHTRTCACFVPSRSLQGGGNLAAICIINRPDPGEHLGNNQGIFQHFSSSFF